jgi:UDP-glucose:(heptosyl)LPS alpha-1,3-glucosyltransferase
MSGQPLRVLHVVRRYGPVGGMERYVWEVTRELRDLGHEVLVICEVCMAEKPAGIRVVELGTCRPRPRWLALLRFGNHVATWLAQHPQPGSLIHSNERLSRHDITTFHGPPFATIFDKPWWRWLSIRVAMQLFLERRELSVARYIVPNSQFIKQQLADYYPALQHKLTEPVVPGVVSGVIRPAQVVPADGGVIGFVGKEWQRKGLPETTSCWDGARSRTTRSSTCCCILPRPSLMAWSSPKRWRLACPLLSPTCVELRRK